MPGRFAAIVALFGLAACAGSPPTASTCPDGPAGFVAPRAQGGALALPVPSLARAPGRPAVAGEVQPGLVALLAARDPNYRFSLLSRSRGIPWGRSNGGTSLELAQFPNWQTVAGTPAAGGQAVGCILTPLNVQVATSFYGDAVQSSFVGPDRFGSIFYLRRTWPSGGRWVNVSAEAALRQFDFFRTYPATPLEGHRIVMGSLDLRARTFALGPGAPARGCLGFTGLRGGERLDGFICRPDGVGSDRESVRAHLNELRVARLI